MPAPAARDPRPRTCCSRARACCSCQMASNTAPSASSANCGLCSEFYVDPRLLQCIHSFCSKCLKKLTEEQGRSETSLTCPTCDKTTSLPEGGIDSLPKDLRKNYEVEVAQYESKFTAGEDVSCDQCIDTSNGPAVSFCVNCCEFLCEPCTKHHKSWRKTVSHELQLMKRKEKTNTPTLKGSANIPRQPVHCELHRDETLKFFCETCSVPLCRDCIILKHNGHKYERMEAVAEKQKVELTVIVKDLENDMAELDSAMTQGGKMSQQIQTKQKSIEEKIRSTFKNLHEALNGREEELLRKITECGLGKQTALSIQSEELKAVRDELTETCETVTTAVKTYAPLEILSAKETMAARLLELKKTFDKVSLKPCRSNAMLDLLDSSEIIESINSFGTVGSSDPSRAEVDLHIPRAILKKETVLTVTTHDVQGKRWPLGGEKVDAILSLMGSDDSPVIADVVDVENGTYRISFSPTTCGEHELSITVENQPIKGSPFHLYVRQERQYTSCKSALQTFSTSDSPYGIAVDDNGDVYVANHDSHHIQVLNKKGEEIRSIHMQETSFCPRGIAIHGSMLYVTDDVNNCVLKFTTTGEFISKMATEDQGDTGLLCQPRGICLSRDGRIFVADLDKDRISVLESDGTLAYHITGSASNGSALSRPWGVALDPKGNLHVTNCGSTNVVIFTQEGKYVSQYSSGASQLTGIAIDEEGYSFVADDKYSNIFDPLHKHIHTLQSFKNARGVAIDRDGYMYVASCSDKRIYKY